MLALMAGATVRSGRPAAPAASRHRHAARSTRTTSEVESSKGDTLLRLTNRIANKGRGPLEIYPSAKSHGCDGDADPDNDRDASSASSSTPAGTGSSSATPTPTSEHFTFGCDRYDPHAHHWDVFNLARYQLRRRHSGRTVARDLEGRVLHGGQRPGLPLAAGRAGRALLPAGRLRRELDAGRLGGLGGRVLLRAARPGPRTSPGSRPAATASCPRPTRANLLREANNSNNRRRTRIELRPAKHVVKTLPGPCRVRR